MLLYSKEAKIRLLDQSRKKPKPTTIKHKNESGPKQAALAVGKKIVNGKR